MIIEQNLPTKEHQPKTKPEKDVAPRIFPSSALPSHQTRQARQTCQSHQNRQTRQNFFEVQSLALPYFRPQNAWFTYKIHDISV